MSKLTGKQKARARKKKQRSEKQQKAKYYAQLKSRILLWDASGLNEDCIDLTQQDDCEKIAHDLTRILAVTDNGVGLSAPQIGIHKRVFVMRPDHKKNLIKILINPKIIKNSEEEFTMMEGCLSYPGIYCSIERPRTIKLEYYDEKWRRREESFSSLSSRVIQHEVEHFIPYRCQVGDYWRKMKFIKSQKTEEQPKIEEGSPALQ
ncbi:MAG: hypothetical protein GF383_08675 [Candidatus Lokiarchaeota archaeon]|nr:hypothetical protein [Candidatus Lokiarchaeota archaeon]